MTTPLLPSYMLHPWDRRPDEPDEPWGAFIRFRDWAYPEGYDGRYRDRRLSEVAIALQTPSTRLRGWCSSYDWHARAGAFDRELDRRRVEVGLNDLQRVQATHGRILAKASGLVEHALDDLRARVEAGETLSPGDWTRMCDMVLKAERLHTGQSTENVSVQHRIDLSKLSYAEGECECCGRPRGELQTWIALAEKVRA